MQRRVIPRVQIGTELGQKVSLVLDEQGHGHPIGQFTTQHAEESFSWRHGNEGIGTAFREKSRGPLGTITQGRLSSRFWRTATG
ncbi:MAG: hypothetical protein A2V70_20630 [Planctomycetes bacterium RBG_13_63_9]|nr:MAG: hypothetical protein A2V70_20630 [Planctomycetes bacterium RBG_13_63_9]